MITFADTIKIGYISAYLANIDSLKSSLFGRKLDTRLQLMLQMETEAVDWMYQLSPTDTSLTSTVNYLYELCGSYVAKASMIAFNVITGGSIAVLPVSANGYVYTSIPFVVTATDTGTGMPVNNTTVWINTIFIGAQQLSFLLVDNVPESIGFGFTFDPTIGKIVRTNPFITGSTVVVSFLRKL